MARPKKTAPLKFATQKNYVHHLYKLLLANFKANKAPDGFEPDWKDNEHVHWFHSITSDGKPQLRSNAVGGHFHKMELVDQGPGNAPIVTCVSGPLKEVVEIKYNKRIKIEVPANDVDHHTHEVSYEGSNVILERVKNIEAAKLEASLMAHQTTQAPGIQTSDGE